MSEKHLQSKPHAIRNRHDAWWYEEEKGISVIVEPNAKTTTIRIPWKSLEGALKRLKKPQP